MKLEVNVLKEDIKRGKSGDAEQCAIARAVKRALKGNEHGLTVTGVGGGGIAFRTADGQNVSVKTPRVASKFIANFDQAPKSKSKPLSFTLRFSLPAPVETSLSNGN